MPKASCIVLEMCLPPGLLEHDTTSQASLIRQHTQQHFQATPLSIRLNSTALLIIIRVLHPATLVNIILCETLDIGRNTQVEAPYTSHPVSATCTRAYTVGRQSGTAGSETPAAALTGQTTRHMQMAAIEVAVGSRI